MREVGRARVGILDGNPPVNHGYRIAGVCRTGGWAERADRSLMQISSCCRRLCQAARTCRPRRACPLHAMAPGIGFSVAKEERPVGDRGQERDQDHDHERGA